MQQGATDVDTILFITLSNVGDAILTTPTLALLNQCFPEAQVDIVGDQRSIELFQHCPYKRQLYKKQKQKFLRGSIDLIWKLRNNHYDLIVDLRTDMLPLLLHGRLKYSRRHGEKLTHSVEQHVSVIKGLSVNMSIPVTQLWLSEQDKQFARRQLSVLPGKKRLAIGPGANWEKKIWPWQRYAALAAQLMKSYDSLVLLGNAQDGPYAEAIMAETRQPCINLCGKTNLLQAAAVLQQCQLFVGNDSGLGHLASAVATPTFTLFGPGQPERYRPWGVNAAWYVDPQQDINQINVQQAMQKLQHHLTSLGQTIT